MPNWRFRYYYIRHAQEDLGIRGGVLGHPPRKRFLKYQKNPGIRRWVVLLYNRKD